MGFKQKAQKSPDRTPLGLRRFTPFLALGAVSPSLLVFPATDGDVKVHAHATIAWEISQLEPWLPGVSNSLGGSSLNES